MLLLSVHVIPGVVVQMTSCKSSSHSLPFKKCFKIMVSAPILFTPVHPPFKGSMDVRSKVLRTYVHRCLGRTSIEPLNVRP